MAFSFFSQNSKHHRRIVIDVSNGSVSGASVIFKKNLKPHIECAIDTPLPIQERVDATTLLNNTEKALGVVMRNIQQQVKHTGPVLVDVVCSSPWFSAETRAVSYERKEVFVVNEKFIRGITDKEIQAMKSGAPSDTLLAEEHIAHIKLNGYETQHPFGKKASHIELLLFSSFIPKSFAERVTNTLQQHISAERVTFHSFPFVSLRALSRVWRDTKDFVHLHVGAEISELLVVKNGAISETFSFPLGNHHIVRAVSDTQNISFEMAESALAALFHGDRTDERGDIERILAPIREEWLAYIDNIILESEPEHQHISTLFLSADPSMFEMWVGIARQRAEKVIPLLTETLESFVEYQPGHLPSTSTLLEILYIDSLDEKKHLH